MSLKFVELICIVISALSVAHVFIMTCFLFIENSIWSFYPPIVSHYSITYTSVQFDFRESNNQLWKKSSYQCSTLGLLELTSSQNRNWNCVYKSRLIDLIFWSWCRLFYQAYIEMHNAFQSIVQSSNEEIKIKTRLFPCIYKKLY